ncbi:MFS general substrate transporter [Vararia minispora EC-137]|uniref:MFS general substrate transporter n=1 Tax=Vararia minispora EC-137 TaxID=1314806 RepID=A0ACB8QKV0_9AGAM|nr:MFS general substrate transporter [Vararia minispora EC-137]
MKDPFLVDVFDPGDPANPLNWSRGLRWFYTAVSCVLVLSATCSSAAPSNLLDAIRAEFSFSDEVGSLVVAMFVAGYCVGPLLWGPLSEQFGRRPIFLLTFLSYTGFQIGCALAPNIALLILFRFLSGVFAAAPLTNSGAVTADLWEPATRSKAMTLFSAAPFGGPALGPIVAGWIAVSGADWRWLFWALAMFSGVCLLLVLLCLPETYAPVLLARKAARIRKDTGDARYRAPLETSSAPLAQRANRVLATPFRVLFREPVLIALTIYMSFVYGCLYITFEAYPIVFSRDHHLNAGVSGLMFIPVGAGGVLGCLSFLALYKYAPHAPPETHLSAARVGAPLYAASFFWFGWTSFSSISFWAPMMAGGLLGFGTALIFLSLVNYIVDMYLFVAASALAAVTVSRSIFAAVFPLFATRMFTALTPRWAATVLGCVALLMVPIPFVLVRYGPYLRSRSRFAPPRAPVRNEEKGRKEGTAQSSGGDGVGSVDVR